MIFTIKAHGIFHAAIDFRADERLFLRKEDFFDAISHLFHDYRGRFSTIIKSLAVSPSTGLSFDTSSIYASPRLSHHRRRWHFLRAPAIIQRRPTASALADIRVISISGGRRRCCWRRASRAGRRRDMHATSKLFPAAYAEALKPYTSL